MRVVFCKNMSSSRIWHDLQASLQVPPQGLFFCHEVLDVRVSCLIAIKLSSSVLLA